VQDEKFDRRSLRERCVAHLREQILSGVLRPGEHIKEVPLAEALGISRGTLREAVRSIEMEGLVESDGRGHVRVRSLGPAQIAEVFEVRTALELLAAKRVALSPRREEFAAQLTSALRPLERDDLSFTERINTDLAFHELLCRLSGSAPLLSAWSPLIGQIRMMIVASGMERASRRMRFDDHVVIVEAIRTGDLSTVRRALTDHMGHFAHEYGSDAPALQESPDETLASADAS